MTDVDEQLQALGLWEEDMSEEQKLELLKVVAVSKETAQLEEAVRCHQRIVPECVPCEDDEGQSPQKNAGEEITVDSDDDCVRPEQENQWPQLQPAWSSSHSPEIYEDEAPPQQGKPERWCGTSKSTRSHKLAMEYHLPLEWDEGPSELLDKRLDKVAVSSEREGLPCPPNVVRSLEVLHDALQRSQRRLPLRPWCAPLSERDRHQLPRASFPPLVPPTGFPDAAATEPRAAAETTGHPKRPHQEEEELAGDPCCWIVEDTQ